MSDPVPIPPPRPKRKSLLARSAPLRTSLRKALSPTNRSNSADRTVSFEDDGERSDDEMNGARGDDMPVGLGPGVAKRAAKKGRPQLPEDWTDPQEKHEEGLQDEASAHSPAEPPPIKKRKGPLKKMASKAKKGLKAVKHPRQDHVTTIKLDPDQPEETPDELPPAQSGDIPSAMVRPTVMPPRALYKQVSISSESEAPTITAVPVEIHGDPTVRPLKGSESDATGGDKHSGRSINSLSNSGSTVIYKPVAVVQRPTYGSVEFLPSNHHSSKHSPTLKRDDPSNTSFVDQSVQVSSFSDFVRGNGVGSGMKWRLPLMERYANVIVSFCTLLLTTIIMSAIITIYPSIEETKKTWAWLLPVMFIIHYALGAIVCLFGIVYLRFLPVQLCFNGSFFIFGIVVIIIGVMVQHYAGLNLTVGLAVLYAIAGLCMGSIFVASFSITVFFAVSRKESLFLGALEIAMLNGMLIGPCLGFISVTFGTVNLFYFISGGVCLVLALVTLLALRSDVSTDASLIVMPSSNLSGLLPLRQTWVLMAAMMTVWASFAFFVISLWAHLVSHNIYWPYALIPLAIAVALIFLVVLLSGFLFRKITYPWIVLACTFALSGVAFLLYGPAPFFFGITTDLAKFISSSVAAIVIVITCCTEVTVISILLFSTAWTNGFADSMDTARLVSALMGLIALVGIGLGVSVGLLGTLFLSREWFYVIIGGVHLMVLLIVLLHHLTGDSSQGYAPIRSRSRWWSNCCCPWRKKDNESRSFTPLVTPRTSLRRGHGKDNGRMLKQDSYAPYTGL